MTDLPPVPFVDCVAARYDAILFDLDGTVYVGDHLTPGAAEVVAAVRHAGKRVLFLTNDPRFGPGAFAERLTALGIPVDEAEMLPVARAIAEMLKARGLAGRTAVVVGGEALAAEVEWAGLRVLRDDAASRAEVVVVATDEHVRYHDIRRAAQAARRGAVFVGANRDATFPMPDGPWPGAGAILAAVECASGRRAEVIGKPEPAIFDAARLLLPRDAHCLMIGDRLDADVGGAIRAGLDAALVLTGTASRAEVDTAAPRPRYVFDDLRGLLDRPE